MIQYQRIYPETTLLRLFTLVDAAEFKGVVRGYDLVRNWDGISFFYNPQIQNLYANEGLKTRSETHEAYEAYETHQKK